VLKHKGDDVLCLFKFFCIAAKMELLNDAKLDRLRYFAFIHQLENSVHIARPLKSQV